MAKVALCWELGRGSGHLSILADFIEPLKQQGHEVSLISQNIQTAQNLPAFDGMDVYQAPTLQVSSKNYHSINYSTLLLSCGYDEANNLTAAIKAWQLLFDLINVDFIIAEHSPTALLAAKLRGLKCAMTGSGFMVPPLTDFMPSFRLWEQVDEMVLKEADQLLLNHVNEAMALLKLDSEMPAQPLQFVNEVFSHALQWIASFPELDHYYGHRSKNTAEQRYLCYRPEVLIRGVEPVWPKGDGEKVFIYSPQSPHLDRICHQLKSSSYNALLVVPDLNEQLKDKWSAHNIKVQQELVNIEKVAEQSRLVISQASYSTVLDFLLKGVPSLFMPIQIESTMFSIRLGLQKLGFAGNPTHLEYDILSMLKTVKDVQSVWDSTGAFAKKYADAKSSQDVLFEITQKNIQ